MRRIPATAVFVVLWAGWGVGIAAEDDSAERPASPQQIAELIEQLGADSYAVREKATRALVKVGIPAKALLLETLDSNGDPEVRARCRRALAVVLEMDYQRRLEAFVNDTEGKQQHDLPGWERFHKLVGRSDVDRKLFVELQRAEPGLMEATTGAGEALGETLATRCLQLQYQINGQFGTLRRPVSLGSAAAVLFAASLEDVTLTDQTNSCIYNFCHQPAFRAAITKGPRVAPLKKLAGAWVKGIGNSTRSYQGLYLAMYYGLPEGLDLAVDLLEGEKGPTHVRSQAMLAIAKLGGRKQLKHVEKLLDDKTVCAISTDPKNRKKRINTELRDVALAVLLETTGQDLKEYGFDRVQKHPQVVFNVSTLGFREAERREAALKQWRAWAAENLRPDDGQDP